MKINIQKAQNLLQDKEIIIIDIRTPKEYNERHLENAINIDFYSEFKDKISRLDKNKKYLIYCRTDNRSSVALKIMNKLGFKKVYEIEGGVKGYEKLLVE